MAITDFYNSNELESVKLSIVVPCFNESFVLPLLLQNLHQICSNLITNHIIQQDVELIFVDDGSTDDTWKLITHDLVQQGSLFRIKALRLCRNYGQQKALLAGLTAAHGDIVISMDADLQDDPLIIENMIEKWRDGADIVCGQRSSRKEDSFFKRNSANLYYRLMSWLGVDLIPDHADYRLMSRKALNELALFGEGNIFLRGLISQLGMKVSIVPYKRTKRKAGDSKYTFFKMLSLACDGITSFSVRPLRLIFICGLTIAIFSIIYIIYALVIWSLGGTIVGWTSLIIIILFLGGLQLIALGIIGEYIGKIYMETKHRPRYLIEEEFFSTDKYFDNTYSSISDDDVD